MRPATTLPATRDGAGAEAGRVAAVGEVGEVGEAAATMPPPAATRPAITAATTIPETQANRASQIDNSAG